MIGLYCSMDSSYSGGTGGGDGRLVETASGPGLVKPDCDLEVL